MPTAYTLATMRTTRGILIGRFQPFHHGHLQVVDNIVEEVDELVLGIGSADVSHEPRNPFTAGERIMMIQNTLEPRPTTTYAVPLEDLERNSVWVSHVQSMSPWFDVAYANNPLVVRLFREAGVEVRQTEMYDRDKLKGTEIRDLMLADDSWEEFVPTAVVDVIDEIDGINRLRAVC
jgi:nicotinamide-nucleotide adenylyltransferase